MDILKKLGFGTMRLPVDENEDINYELIGQMEMLCGSLMRDIAVVSKKKIKICFTYQDEFDDMCYLIQKMKGEHEIWQG